MKKNNISLFALGAVVISLTMISALIGCKFNLSDTKYLKRPDVEIFENGLRIHGDYVSSDIEHINIYRQDMDNSKIERIALLDPKGDTTEGNQNFFFYDNQVCKNHTYRYYVRFVTTKGEKNRTEWSEQKKATAGADNPKSFQYNLNNAYYEYDKDNAVLTIKPDGKHFEKPSNTVIADIDEYETALVFQTGDLIQTFTVASTDTVNLKELLPQEFYNTDIILLGIVGQKVIRNENAKGAEKPLQSVTWTSLTPVTVKKIDFEHDFIRIDTKYGTNGFDYSILSDNEN